MDATDGGCTAARQLARSSTDSLDANPLFSRSLDPMLLVDDARRCVDANAAACLFFRQPIEAVRRLILDDLTAPGVHARLDAMWSQFIQRERAVDDLPRDLQLPDGTRVAVTLSVTPRIRPGRHLVSIRLRAPHALVAGDAARAKGVLTKREREILTLVALGSTGVEIARELFLSPATVQTHVANALIKLNANNRAHGILLALQTNELDLGDRILGR